MDPLLENLLQYGVLGLWTASLLYANTKMRKDFQVRYDQLNEKGISLIRENNHLLETLLDEQRLARQIRETSKKGD